MHAYRCSVGDVDDSIIVQVSVGVGGEICLLPIYAYQYGVRNVDYFVGIDVAEC